MKTNRPAVSRSLVPLLVLAAACGQPELAPETASQTQALCTGPSCGPPPPCSTLLAAPTTAASYSCDLTLTDLLGRPISGQTVTFTAQWCNTSGLKTLATGTALTGSDGHAHLPLSTTGANMLACQVTTSDAIVSGGAKQSGPAFPSGTTLPVAATKYPLPTASVFVNGLETGQGNAVLYQSGAYDKVVMIPEYFDMKENDPTARRDQHRFFDALSTLITQLYGQGYDVWLFEPHATGDNLHEQAAELAQAVNAAAHYSGGPACGNGELTLFGLNTGALVARIASARWEQDKAWTTALGIYGTLPVDLLLSGDGMHLGMNLNIDLQKALYTNKSAQQIHQQTNLDSCAATQLTESLYTSQTPWGTGTEWFGFFLFGQTTGFYSSLDATVHTCAAGPAVEKLGWPVHPRRFGWANSNRLHTNRCYGSSRDYNANGDNLCKYATDFTTSFPFVPQATQSWLKISPVDPIPALYFNAYLGDDLAPGSRNPIFFDGLGEAGPTPFNTDVTYRQRFATTMIPWTSAADVSDTTKPSPFADADFMDNPYNASMDSVNIEAMNEALNRLASVNASSTCRATITSTPPPPGGGA
jgi:hypothetical protein